MTPHAYTQRLFSGPELSVSMHFNLGGPLRLDHPYTAIDQEDDSKLHAFFPAGTWDLVSVAHEATHVGFWVVFRKLSWDRALDYKLEDLVPKTDVSWTHSMSRVREEAVCKLHDTVLRRAISELEEQDIYYKLSAPRLRLQRSGT